MSADDEVHYFDGPGIEEGMGSVPRWFIAFMAILFIVVVAYLGVYLVDAQPSSAQMKSSDAVAETPADAPAAGEPTDDK